MDQHGPGAQHAFWGQRTVSISGNVDDLKIGARGAQSFCQFRPADFGHDYVRNEQVDSFGIQGCDPHRVSCVAGGEYFVSDLGEELDDNLAQRFLVFNQKNGFCSAAVFQGGGLSFGVDREAELGFCLATILNRACP